MMFRPTRKWMVLGLVLGASAQSLTDSQLTDVTDRLAEAAQQSWELGTRSQALLEYNARTYSVFSSTSLPPPAGNTDGLNDVLGIARDIVSDRASSNGNTKGAQPLMKDGSAADPASNGVGVLIANWTGQDDQDYAGAATDQLNYLLYDVPRSSTGAISHRVSEAQLWSDFVYMVPPFLAYYGVMTSNKTLVSEAYNQIKLYRDELRDTSANNLWKHIQLGSGTDGGHWSTGNGWAAAGMLRTLSTIQNSQFSGDFDDEKNDLKDWTLEIQDAMYDIVDDTHIFRNYADDESTFYDCASTALMAASVYRLSQVSDDQTHIAKAEAGRKALYASGTTSTTTASASAAASSSTSASGLVHFTSDGWLTPVVNPHQYGVEGSESAEAQAFILMMQASYDDWVDAGSPGNGAFQLQSSSWAMMLGVALAMIVLL